MVESTVETPLNVYLANICNKICCRGSLLYIFFVLHILRSLALVVIYVIKIGFDMG
jgi:hypothetical protein